MPRAIRASVLSILVAFCAVTVSADSNPELTGGIAGIELCPQSICGAAIFVGGFEGELNSKPASGAFVGAINHAPLPGILQQAPITGGSWTITAGKKTLTGDVVGGAIINLNGVQFCVATRLVISQGGHGLVYFTGLLDHGPFPPTITGIVSQSPLPCSAVIP